MPDVVPFGKASMTRKVGKCTHNVEIWRFVPFFSFSARMLPYDSSLT